MDAASKKRVPNVSLATKIEPSQERARATFELILSATGELLAEVGVERLSTNMICERAGITPPALYRYFPNKYAILSEMGRRLMEAEDALVFDWLESGRGDRQGTLEESVASHARILRAVRKVAEGQPGGAWILRVMHAVPMLRDVRAQSVRAVADALCERLHRVFPAVDHERLRTAAMLSTTLTSAANEMIMDNPELEERVTQEVSRMVALYYDDLLTGPRSTTATTEEA